VVKKNVEISSGIYRIISFLTTKPIISSFPAGLGVHSSTEQRKYWLIIQSVSVQKRGFLIEGKARKRRKVSVPMVREHFSATGQRRHRTKDRSRIDNQIQDLPVSGIAQLGGFS
jgi:hypothetical protein